MKRTHHLRLTMPRRSLALFCFAAALLFVILQQPAHGCGAVGGDNRGASEPLTSCAQLTSVHPGDQAGSATDNSVDIITGNKFFSQRDAYLPGGLSLVRSYNSRNTFKSALGRAWRHNFEATLAVRPGTAERAGSAQIVQGDGRRIVFKPAPVSAKGGYIALDPRYGTLHHQPMLGPDRRWRWQWRDGSRLTFSVYGRLTMVARTDGRLLHLHYDRADGRLSKVGNRHGQSLRFHYHSRSHQLASVELPDGQHISYRYDAFGNLHEVQRDDKTQWRFDYADEHVAAVVAVRNAAGQIVRHVRYDEQGRAVYSSLENDAQALRFQYRLPLGPDDIGSTLITAADGPGQANVYRWRYDPVAQRRQMLDAQGPGCPGCPPVGMRRTYTHSHRPAKTILASGDAVSERFDDFGRLVSVSVERASTSAKAAPMQLLRTALPGPLAARHAAPARPHVVRFHYAGSKIDEQPSRITQPSVAPGREHTLTIQRDALDRITSLTETGFAPELGSLRQVQGSWRFERWRKLSRTWSISYVDFGAAAGLPAVIDGPLPGPKDAIRFVYDRQGRRIAQFGPYRQSWQWRWHPNGMLAEVRSLAGATQRFEYDPLNRLVSHRRDGVMTELARDDTRRVLTLRPSNRPELSIGFNSRLLPASLHDTHGSRLVFNRAGLPLSGLQAGNASRPLRSPDPSLGATRLQARPASGEYKLSWRDDFGRTLAELDSETGLRLYAYDLADRPIARIDESRRVQIYRYAPNGQFSGFAAAGSAGWHQRFKRGRVVRRDEFHQQLRRKLDSHRHIVQTRINYQDPLTGQRFDTPLTLERSYDQRGRLHERSIGRGWKLRYEWADTNELAGLSLVRSVDGVRRKVVSGLRWQPFTGGRMGLRTALWGNGTATHFRFDKALRVQRVEHQGAADDSSLPDVELVYGLSGRVIGRRIGAVDTRFSHDDHGWLSGYQSTIGSARWQYRSDGLRKSSVSTPALRKVRYVKAVMPEAVGQGLAQDNDAPTTTSMSAQSTSPNSAPPVSVGRLNGLVRSPTGATVVLDRAGRPRWAATRDGRAFRYIYNRFGERIGKLRLDQPSASRWFVHENQRLAMETDVGGKPLRSFIYLDGRPAAIVDFVEDDVLIRWVHTDPMGMPVAVTDQGGKVTWNGHFDPFGMHIEHAGNVDPGEDVPFRLAGQYHDEETGYHDNYLRTYDPTRGRYLGPDPLGLRATGLRYAYARNSPLDTQDPLGLYEIDMHYYATFVLAVAAGMSTDDARLIANANQHVDDNHETQPITHHRGYNDYIDSFFNRVQVLRDWHFVLETRVENEDGSFSIIRNESTEISNPTSPRLTTLRNWVDEAADQSRELQMFRLGVYSHAYMDTASHRNRVNEPTPVSPELLGISLNGAVGHAHHAHYPDYTFNICFEPAGGGELPRNDPDMSRSHYDWPNNESRTLTIQQDMYEIFREYADGAEARISWDELAEVMQQFNAIQEHAQAGVDDVDSFEEKLLLLNQLLQDMYRGMDDRAPRVLFRAGRPSSENGIYSSEEAAQYWNRLFSMSSD